jgi:hypothetical protein
MTRQEICSAIHTFGIPEFDRLFKEHQADINGICSRIDPKYLGFPTVHFLQALTRDKRVPTVTPGGRLRVGGFSQPPVMSQLKPRSSRVASSTTPDPENLWRGRSGRDPPGKATCVAVDM